MKKEEKEEIKKEEAVNEASEKETDNTGNTATPEGNDCENNDADTQTESGNEGGNAGENTAKDPLAEAKDEIEQLKDKYLRSVAEFDNYRKRTLKEKAELILNGSEKAVQAILPVIDDMERAIANAEKTEDVDVLREGMKLIYQKTNKIMESLGVKKIDTENVDFDTNFHEAVAMVPGMGDDKKGKVLDCVQAGYTLNDKVIRHAKVAVGQ
jgi:molecular chaperone GrpE